MKLKNTTLTLMIMATAFSTLNATPNSPITNIDTANAKRLSPDELGNFFYNKGQISGRAEGEKIGFEKASKVFLRKLKKYAQKIKAYESGKKLYREEKITAPRIYQQKLPDGTVRVVVKGCKLHRQLSPEDIFNLPSLGNDYHEDEGGNGESNLDGGNNGSVTDNVSLAGVDIEKRKAIPYLPSANKKIVYRTFPSTDFYLSLCRNAKLICSVNNSKGTIRAIFKTKYEADTFMLANGLTAGKDYK